MCKLESLSWAPWLVASRDSFYNRISTFSDGQFLIQNAQGDVIAILSTNRIFWNGKIKELPSWMDIAGNSGDFRKLYDEKGNTLVMMSISIDKKHHALRLPEFFIKHLIEFAKHNNIDRIIGSFRPSEYGLHKFKFKENALSFETYITSKNDKNLPLDKWLRVLYQNGVVFFKVDENAMCIPILRSDMENYRQNYNSRLWWQPKENVWECVETGAFFVLGDVASYIESNIWGTVWTAK